MKKALKNIEEQKKIIIGEQDYLSEEQKKKAAKEQEKAEELKKLNPEEFFDPRLASEKRPVDYEPDFFRDEDMEKDDGKYNGFGKEFLAELEEAKKNKENDIIGAKDYKKLLKAENNKYEFTDYYSQRKRFSDLMALRMGVKQETIDKINAEAKEKFGKDIFSEAVDSGVVNIGANIVGGGDLVLDRVVGWKNNPLSKANEYLQKRAAEEEKEVMEAVERTGKGSSAEFSAKVIVAVTEALPDLAIALMSGGGSTAATAAKGIRKVINSTWKNPNFWYAAETQLYPIYKEALAEGATEDEALRTALGGAPLSAGLEGNLGFEKYVKTKTPMTLKKGLWNYAKAGALEGVEETVKSAAPEVIEKWVFDKDKPLLGAREGEEAVLNLEEAGRDFLIGSAVGAFNSTPRLFDISLDAYGDKKRKNGWNKTINTDRIR